METVPSINHPVSEIIFTLRKSYFARPLSNLNTLPLVVEQYILSTFGVTSTSYLPVRILYSSIISPPVTTPAITSAGLSAVVTAVWCVDSVERISEELE